MTTADTLTSFANCLESLATREAIASTKIEGLYLIHSSKETTAVPALYEPSVCIIAQGSKKVMVGKKVLQYRAGQCLVASLDLPVKGSVIGATSKVPYLCLMLTIKAAILYDLLPSVVPAHQQNTTPNFGLSVHSAEDELLECSIKLCKLLSQEADIPVLAPMVIREMHYRLLKSAQSEALRRIAAQDGAAQRIAKTIGYLKENFAKPLAIARLAKLASMSESSFHAHFKAATSMSPIQFQKQLRLLEARRRLVVHGTDASNTAYEVGYESISQFSREYARMFGLPPMKDAERLRSGPGGWYGSSL